MPHNKVIYAVGIGSVGFIPRIGGNEQAMIEFTQVLHVPDLCNSLLSVLYLTKHHGLSVFIEGSVVKFTLNGTLLFTATAAEMTRILPILMALLLDLSQPISVPLSILFP
jgi:hypothetical protein